MTSRSGTERPPVHPLAAILVLAFGTAAGMIVGLAALSAPHDAGGIGTAYDPILAMAIGGALGVLGSYFVLLNRHMRAMFRRVFGATIGAMAGLFVFIVGYTSAHRAGASGLAEHLGIAAQGIVAGGLWELLAIAVGGFVGLSVTGYSWRFQGLLAFVALATTVTGYLAYTVLVTIPSVPPSSLPLSVVLFVAEAAMLLLVLVYAFYPLDVVGRKRWLRTKDMRRFSKYYLPKVALHVPTYNEPPDIVLDTLRSLLVLDYPKDRMLLMVMDDSTDPEAAGPVEAFCREHGIPYHHRAERRGFKAGALNEALRHTPQDVDLIAVVDADYQVRPEYLRETVGYFAEPGLAFVQTPQDYRNVEESFLTRQYYFADSYFYHTVLPSRNEGNTIIFCGTMGIIRRSVLEEVGCWSEAHVTEDAELAVRILAKGHDTLYVDKTYGHGLIPSTFHAYKRQHNRWAFGSGQILRTHLWEILGPRLSMRQRFDYLAGNVHWFDGMFVVMIALVLVALGIGDLLGTPVITHHQQEIWLVGLVPLFLLVEATLRVQLSLRRRFDLSLGQTFTVFGMWFSVKFSNMMAALNGFFGATAPFARTPKVSDAPLPRRQAVARAIDLTFFESLTAGILVAVSGAFGIKTLALWSATGHLDAGRVFLSGWLLLYALIFASAPLYAYRSYVAPRIRARRDAAPKPAAEQAPTRPATPAERRRRWATRATLGAILVLALALRLRDPLSSPIIGAEDPYLHMERTWNLVQGMGPPQDYPPGFAMLLAPLTALGPDGFYLAARFLPPLLGVAEVIGIYWLCRGRLSAAGALAAAFVAAVMPENIIRTNILFPTAFDLAILPFLFVFIIRAVEGDRKAVLPAGALAAFLLFIHPWVVGLVVPAAGIYAVLRAPAGRRGRIVLGSAAVFVLVLAILPALPATWNPMPRFMANAGPAFTRLVQDPSTLLDFPQFVNLPFMLTTAVLVVGGAGAIVAAVRRRPLDVFALVWCGLLLPLVLVDWFGSWFLPHRTVAYLSIGAAPLVGVAFDEAVRRLPSPRPVRIAAGAAMAAALVVATLPAGAAAPVWYRLFDGDDYLVFADVATEHPSVVITGSWQERTGYRGLTGEVAWYHPGFFKDPALRDRLVGQRHDLVVIVEPRAEAAYSTRFLENWTIVSEHGDVRAYRHPSFQAGV